MNRTLLVIAGMFSASSLLLLDSAVKGAAILAVAACAAMMMRRDSAATRHLVWLLAIIALLAVPVLSAVLPQWRVLPEWTGFPPATVAAVTRPLSVDMPANGDVESPRRVQSVKVEPSVVAAHQGAVAKPESPQAIAPTGAAVAPPELSWSLRNTLPLVWAIGCSVFVLRLAAARLMLWNTERRAIMIRSSGRDAANRDHLTSALEAACLQLEITRPVSLLIHAEKTIPVVWGIWRYCLLLPAAARDWSGEQLRSVLLHELAHVKRRDTLAQLLAQIACALHWFNPLAWFAAWRLGVERERACDDLVLARGVRPSAYAGHLLEVVAACSPVRWTQSCGLAMARRSSLEGRLVAVLSDKLNRRGVSLALAAIALAVSIGIAVPIAMLRAADEKPGAKPAEKSGEKPKPAPTNLKPRHEYAQSLFQKWQASARTDGKIPGALIGLLAREVDSFLKQYPKDEKSPKLAALRPRLDAAHDWAPADVVALLNDITAISTAPVSWLDISLGFDGTRNIQAGTPLPVELASADWGKPAASGLRAAWLLEPRAEQYPLGSVLKSRVLFHNAGQHAVVFRTETWHQYDHPSARDAQGAEIKVSGPLFSGITMTATYRLAPGEYCEVMGHGIAIGAGNHEEEFSTGSVGAVIEAKTGDDVRLAHEVEATNRTWTRPDDPTDPVELWKKQVAERVEREAPLPEGRADREQLVRRVTMDIFGEPPTAAEIVLFVADQAPDALAKLTVRLQAKPHVEPWHGELATGETRFHVTPADPDAAQKPRTANTPGRYVLGENIHLLVSQTTTDARRANKAIIAFLSPDPKVASRHKAYEIELPDGLGTYGIAWQRGAGVLWVVQKGLVRKCDFTNPDAVKETRFEPGGSDDLPKQFRDPLKTLLSTPGGPAPQHESLKPKGGEKLAAGLEQRLKWSETVNGLRAAILIRVRPNAKPGDLPDLYLTIQNASNAAVHLADTDVPANVPTRTLYHKKDGAILYAMGAREPGLGNVVLQPREFVLLPMFDPDHKLNVPADPSLNKHTIGSQLVEGALKDPSQSFAASFEIAQAPAGAWMGKLLTTDATAAIAVGKPQPQGQEAQALYEIWQRHARANGNFPGGLIARLSVKVKEFIRGNTGDASGDPYAKKMTPIVPRLDAARDWTPAEVISLFDDIAAVTPVPLETMRDDIAEHTFQTGSPLPPALANAPWGEKQQNGLRMAYLLEPRSGEHPLGTPLTARILVHNAGKDVVVFRTRAWHQLGHVARDSQGAEINVESVQWLTIGQLTAYRLWPGEFIELIGPGIGVGANKNDEQWQNAAVGSWVDAKAGDDVTITTSPLPLYGWNEKLPENGAPQWWLEFIKARLALELPLPADAEERQHLVYRAGMQIFGTPLSAAEIAAFVSDRDANALDSLAQRLAKRPGTSPFAGDLTSGPTKFHVLPADPDAAKKPRVANNPGQYTLGENATFSVTRRPFGERIANEASIQFSSPDATQPAPAKPRKIALPDGYGTWVAGWVRGSNVLWVMQRWGIWSYDFSNPADVKETHIEHAAAADKVPQPILAALHGAVDFSGVNGLPAASAPPAK